MKLTEMFHSEAFFLHFTHSYAVYSTEIEIQMRGTSAL